MTARSCRQRSAAALALALCMPSCGGAPDGPTATTGQLGFAATGAIISSNRRGGILEAELLLDGTRVASRSFQPAESGMVFLQVSDMFITPGAHRVSLKVVRQATNPTSWDVQIGAAVLNLTTLASQEFKLPNEVQSVTLSSGQSTTLEFIVKP